MGDQKIFPHQNSICVYVCIYIYKPLGAPGAYQLYHTWKESRAQQIGPGLCTQGFCAYRMRPEGPERYPRL